MAHDSKDSGSEWPYLHGVAITEKSMQNMREQMDADGTSRFIRFADGTPLQMASRAPYDHSEWIERSESIDLQWISTMAMILMDPTMVQIGNDNWLFVAVAVHIDDTTINMVAEAAVADASRKISSSIDRYRRIGVDITQRKPHNNQSSSRINTLQTAY